MCWLLGGIGPKAANHLSPSITLLTSVRSREIDKNITLHIYICLSLHCVPHVFCISIISRYVQDLFVFSNPNDDKQIKFLAVFCNTQSPTWCQHKHQSDTNCFVVNYTLAHDDGISSVGSATRNPVHYQLHLLDCTRIEGSERHPMPGFKY